MKFEIYLLLILLVYGVWRTHRSVQRSRSPLERYFTLRVSIFAWVVGLGMLAALILLPFRLLVLLMLPVVFGGLSVAKILRDARERLRRTNENRVDIENMKRVN